MKPILYLLMVTIALSACGVRGKLKRPSEIRQEETKRQQKQQEDNGSF